MHFEDVARAPLLEERRAGYEAEGIRSLLAVPLLVRSEHTATITCYYRQPHAFSQDEVHAAGELADLASHALTTAQLNEEQQRLRAAAEQAERRSDFLAEASKLLASSLDYETTLKHLAQLAVPELADWCTVHLAEAAGPPRQVAVAHVDPAKIEWARAARERLPYDPEAPAGLAKVIRTGRTELYPHVPDALLRERIKEPEHLEIIRQVGLTSVVIVPLQGRDQVLGALTLISAESGVRYDARTVELAEELARRAAVAIDNALLFHEARAALAERTRAEESVRYVMDHAHCLLWHAGVEAPEPPAKGYRWDLHLFDPEAAQRFLPLDLAPGETYAEAFHRHKPEADRRLCDRNARAALESGASGYRQEFRCTDRNGVLRWLQEATQLEQVEPGRWRAVGVCTDITVRKRLEAQAVRLAAIVESSDDAIVSKDLTGVVQSWNRAAERIFGYTEEEMVGRSIALLVPPERPNEEPEILARIVRGERMDHFETIRVRKDGRRIEVSVTISPVRDSTGQIIGASKIARDISVQKALEQELQQRVEALALADRRKDEFLAMLAHELRNPLSPLTTAARIIQKAAGGDPVLARQQAVIERQVRHMSRLLEDLLDVSRITRGKVTLRRETVDLRQVVASAVDACRGAVEERRHALTVTLPDSPARLIADPVRLEQVVSNLLLNAAKYTAPGGRIHLSVEMGPSVPPPGFRQVALRVRDTGVGIAPEFLPSVFDLFSQGDRGLDRSQGGLGIGLTLVRNLVELHGGTVEARSEGPGQGSEFVVHLPLDASEHPEDEGTPGVEPRRHG
jgi:PAS domain S-box-containing protein